MVSLSTKMNMALLRPPSVVGRIARHAMSRPGPATEICIPGTRILLTGASSGIGAAAAQKLAAAGAELLLVARREPELKALQETIAASGGTAHIFCADLSIADDRTQLISKVLHKYGAPDVLVNNAARSIRRDISDAVERLHDYERTMALNYFGPVHLTLGFLPGMQARGGGHIVNVSTTAALLDMAPKYSAYAASKRALGVFGKTLAIEMRRNNIDVTTLYYPLVRTPMAAPTAEYANRPSLSAQEAAEWIVHAVDQRPAEVLPRAARGYRVVTALLPETLLGHAMAQGT